MPVSVTTWPVMWVDISRALDSIERRDLSPAQKRAYDELEFELRYQSKTVGKRNFKLSVANSRAVFNDSSMDYIEKGQVSQVIDLDGDTISFRLQANVVTDPGQDDYDGYLDGTFLSATLGDWVVGAGAIDRWWGPSSNTSLILSNNARPIPAVQFRTHGTQTFESPWLSWIGSWQFVSFVGVMESDRTIPEAHITGMRFTMRPFEGLELGASRAMLWGGVGRPKNLNAFVKSLTSQDENTTDGSGNQLGGFDLRYAFGLTEGLSAAVYSQLTGEDEAGYLPSKYLSQFGLESTFVLPGSLDYLKGFIEFVDTAAGSLNDPQYGAAYGHSTYKTGYYYRDRPIGASFGGDAQVWSAGLSYNMPDNRTASVIVNKMRLNRAGAGTANTISAIPQDLIQIKLAYQTVFLGGRLKLGYSYLDDEFATPQLDVERRAAYGSWEYRF